jgi:hypothetical protein
MNPGRAHKRAVAERAHEIEEAKRVIASRIRLAQIGMGRKPPGPGDGAGRILETPADGIAIEQQDPLAQRPPTGIMVATTPARLMVDEPTGSWAPRTEQGAVYRKEAARLRLLAAEATTDLARKILEDQAQAQDRLAGRLFG